MKKTWLVLMALISLLAVAAALHGCGRSDGKGPGSIIKASL